MMTTFGAGPAGAAAAAGAAPGGGFPLNAPATLLTVPINFPKLNCVPVYAPDPKPSLTPVPKPRLVIVPAATMFMFIVPLPSSFNVLAPI